MTPVSFGPALAIAATFPPARAQAPSDQSYLARVAAPMHALTGILPAEDGQPFWTSAALRGLGATSADPIHVQLRALLALHGLLPDDGRLAATRYRDAPLAHGALHLPPAADRRDGARRVAVWREGHRTLKALARQARAIAAGPATKGSDAARAQALLARLRWAIAAFEERRPFVGRTA